jgi:hypothetical protein
MRIARIRKSDNLCINVELWDNLPTESNDYLFKDCSNYSNANIGTTYDSENDLFVDPEPLAPENVTYGRIISKLAFRRRLTFNERLSLDNYATNESLTAEQKATLVTFHKDFEISMEINLDDPDLAAGIGMLEYYGLVGSGRGVEILGPDAQQSELPLSSL